MAKRYGFYVDQENCIGCFTCQIACKDKNDLPDGVLWRKVYEFSGGTTIEENGVFKSNVFAYWLSMACNHCEDAKCVTGCPTGAMHYGADGTVQHNPDLCIGCQYCRMNCPYDAPKFMEDKGIIGKCDACIDLRETGKNPACVDACIMRVLEFGPIDELRAKHGELADIKGLPDSNITKPSLVINPHKAAIK
ncbi:MAG TPA: DMSO/selenate family reductase complex B subunit [Syntrophomonadaceae bacterium]|nr:DMSO/selenate family reductase complex B subunit [Syntrophomonadaceae bacterium]